MKSRLNYKVIFIPVLIAAAVMMGVLFYIEKTVENATERTYQVLSDSAKEQASVLSEKFDGQFALLEAFAGSVNLGSELCAKCQTRSLSSIVDSSSFIFICVAGTDGKAIVNNGNSLDISQKDYFADALSGKRVISIIESSGKSSVGEPRFIFAVPVPGEDGEAIGVVAGVCDEKGLRGLLISTAYNSRGYSFVCDPQGRVVIGSDDKDYLMDEVSQDNIIDFFSLQTIVRHDHEAGKCISSDLASGLGGVLRYEYGGRERYAVYEPMGIEDWYIFNVVSGEVVNEAVGRESKNALQIVGVILASTFFILIYILTRERNNREKLEAENRAFQLETERFKMIYSKTPLTVWDYDFETKKIINAPSEKNGGKLDMALENVPESLLESGFVHPNSAKAFSEMYRSLAAGEKHVTGVFLIRENGGEEYRYERIRYTNILDKKGKPYRAIGTSEDVTEEREKELAYERYRRGIETNKSDGTMYYEFNLTRNTCELEVGASPSGVVGKLTTLRDMLKYGAENFTYPEDEQKYTELLDGDNLLALFEHGTNEVKLEYRVKDSDTSPRWVRLNVQMAQYPDSQDVKAFMLFTDIDREKKANMQIEERLNRDPLTCALNRSSFINHVEELFKNTEQGVQHAVVMLDLDDFKQVNDSLGHAQGDKVLVAVAENIKSLLRAGDIVGRIGGDEFMICLKNIPDDDVIEKRAKLICRLVRLNLQKGLKISGSLGIAMYPRDGESFELLYEKADQALYAAKALGRNRYMFYQANMRHEEWAPSATPIDAPEAGEAGEESCSSQLGDILRQNGELIKKQEEAESYRVLMESWKPVLFSWNAETGDTSAGEHFNDYLLSNRPIPDIFEYKYDPEAVHPSDRAIFNNKPKHSEAGFRHRTEATVRLKKTDGSYEWCRVTNMYILGSEGQLAKAVEMIIPVDFAREKSDIQLDALLNYMVGGVMLLEVAEGANLKAIYVSPSFYKVNGRTPEEMGDNEGLMQRLVLEEDRASLLEAIHSGSENNTVIDYAYRVHEEGGGVGWRHMRAVRIPYEGSEWPVVMAIITDVTQMKRQEEKLIEESKRMLYLAEHDSLTGLYNRQAFISKAEEIIARNPDSRYVVSVVDIDNFKLINDIFGHEQGDKLLAYLSKELLQIMKHVNGSCGRIGADTFATLQLYDLEMLKKVGEERIKVIEKYDLKFELTSSTGHYLAEGSTLPVGVMIDRAYLAMRSIKGKYGVDEIFYTDKMREKLLYEQEVLGDMEEALKTEQFEIFLQPQYNHETQTIMGAEALVRWRHPVKGLLSPDMFIEVMERNGVITRLDEHVWELACRFLRDSIVKGGKIVPISVNISRVDLYSLGIRDTLEALLAKYGVPRKLLKLEITESAFVDDAKQIGSAIGRLKESGFIIEMDDFGSGYSSLNALKNIPVDVVKLDMKFLEEGGDRERQMTIMEEIIKMVKRLGMRIIAEGVETKEQADNLLAFDCKLVQGYYYARPMPTADFERLLNE